MTEREPFEPWHFVQRYDDVPDPCGKQGCEPAEHEAVLDGLAIHPRAARHGAARDPRCDHTKREERAPCRDLEVVEGKLDAARGEARVTGDESQRDAEGHQTPAGAKVPVPGPEKAQKTQRNQCRKCGKLRGCKGKYEQIRVQIGRPLRCASMPSVHCVTLVQRAGSRARILLWAGVGASGLLARACVPEERPGGGAPGPTTSTAQLAPARSFKTVRRDTDGGSAAPEPAAQLRETFEDDFERDKLGDNYRATSSAWTLDAGRLCGAGTENHPVWLVPQLPTNVRIEFDATSESPDGDIKAEVFGDGHSFSTTNSYTRASGYLLIYGGWKNTLHVLARLNEHGDDRLVSQVNADPPGRSDAVVPGRRYRFKVERRDGTTLQWSVDGVQVHRFTDPVPLKGSGHEHFGFNTWQARVCFDNLSVVPLGN